MKAYACYGLTAVAVIPVNHEFSLLVAFFQSDYREMNGKAVKSIKLREIKLYLLTTCCLY